MIVRRKVIYYRRRKKREKTYSDTINYEIINDKGMLIGQKGISSTEVRQAITAFRLNCNGPVHVTIRHIVNRESLPGISGVGIRLLKK